MQKRGQAAMEFLMTYGWAILAVLISIAALAYFGVLNPSLFLPSSATLMPGLAVRDFKILENAVVLNVQNGIGKNLKDFYLSIPDCISGNSGKSSKHDLKDGETKRIFISCATNFGINAKVKEDIKIYFTEEALSHTRTGSISGKSEPGRLILYYSFDDGTATDLSNSQNSGTIIGTGINCNVQGKSNNGCSLPGTTTDYIIKNPAASFDASEITAEFWAISTDTTKLWATLLSYAQTGCAESFRASTPPSSGFHRLHIQRGCGVAPNFYQTNSIANDGMWHHFRITWKSSSGELIVYKDGIQAASSTISTGTTISTGGALLIGEEQDALGGGFDSTQAFLGTIDEVAIFNIVV